jgi:hypothetical protein
LSSDVSSRRIHIRVRDKIPQFLLKGIGSEDSIKDVIEEGIGDNDRGVCAIIDCLDCDHKQEKANSCEFDHELYIS